AEFVLAGGGGVDDFCLREVLLHGSGEREDDRRRETREVINNRVSPHRDGAEHQILRMHGGHAEEKSNEYSHHPSFRERTARCGRPGSFMVNLPVYVPAAVTVISHGSITSAVNCTPAGRSKAASAG